VGIWPRSRLSLLLGTEDVLCLVVIGRRASLEGSFHLEDLQVALLSLGLGGRVSYGRFLKRGILRHCQILFYSDGG
jgi:hypothetical protein